MISLPETALIDRPGVHPCRTNSWPCRCRQAQSHRCRRFRHRDAGQQRHDLTTCATLLSCFDFEHRGGVGREDWQRGCRMMNLGDMGDDDELWETLLQKFARRSALDLCQGA